MDLLTRAVIISTVIAVILHRRNISSGLHLSWGLGSQPPLCPGSWSRELRFKKINESLYELEEPQPPLDPNLIILFFHGFYSCDSLDSHFSTWASGDESCLWPSTWLVKEFDRARILYVSYNAYLQKSSQGTFGMHNIVENLAIDLMQANIGQTPNCPVILVGHCFGGLVIKGLCLYMTEASERDDRKRIGFGNFLQNMKGIFYYGTPHKGSLCVKKATKALVRRNPLLRYFKLLNEEAGLLDSNFNKLWVDRFKWEIRGLGEGLPTDQGLFQGVVVAPEATSRVGDQFNVVPEANHYSICRPTSETDRRFYALASLVQDIEVEIPADESPALPKHRTQLKERAREVQEKLKDDSKPVLGIFGMGGIGKTTLAIQVYNNIWKDFEYTCFLEKVKGVQASIKDKLLSAFCHRGKEVHGTKWADLNQKRILIVLDDFDSYDDLYFLSSKMDDFMSGSRIIVTCRNKEVLRACEEYQLYEVAFLKMDEAKKLFCRQAFRREDVPEATQINNLDSYVRRVIGKCDGLPLTLVVMGRYLRDHTENVNIWEESIDKLDRALWTGAGEVDRVMASLRMSYDDLPVQEKRMFIEAGTIFWDEPLSRALAAWSTVFEHPHTMWINLVDRSLVKETVKGNRPKQVLVHEHMRDLAKSLGNRNAHDVILADADNLLEMLNSNKVPEETTSLYISCPLETRLQIDSLAKVKKLAYLRLCNVEIEGSGQNFPRELSMLKWETCEFKREMSSKEGRSFFNTIDPESGSFDVDVPANMLSTWSKRVEERPLFPISLNGMSNLTVLELRGWTVAKVSFEELAKLSNLRLLTLSQLSGLNSLPEDFGDLLQLQQLILEDLSLPKLPKSIGKLAALEVLILERVECLELPESVGELSSLVNFVIVGCRKLASLPVSFGCDLKMLESLIIYDCPLLECLPQSLGQISRLRRLKIERCGGLKELGASFGGFPALEHLSLDVENFEGLPPDFELPTSLEALNWQSKLFRLPGNIGHLIALKVLGIKAANVDVLLESLGEFISLELLGIECDNLARLPESLGQLAGLTDLLLRAESLEALPDNLGLLSSLESITIAAECLETLPVSVGSLQSLNEFVLYCPKLRSLPNSVGQLSNLRNFELCCDGLERLPDGLDNLPLSSLRLKLSGSNTKRLPEGLGNLSTLVDLELEFPKLTKVPDELGNLSCLRKLVMSHCHILERLPLSLGRIWSLKEMELKDCRELKSLPDNLGKPSPSQVAPPQAEKRNGKMRLLVVECEFLDDSRMENFGWVREKKTRIGKGWRQREDYFLRSA